ncbi:MAG: tetratricopeptide repeat protein [Pirellulales bacterium]|nr:tetratricopeptide repeat protein [Pirellulales bacterium]
MDALLRMQITAPQERFVSASAPRLRAGAVPYGGRLLVALGLCLLSIMPGGCAFTQRFGSAPKAIVNSRQLSSQGISAIEREDWAEAETLLAEAVQTCDVDPQARRYYAQALWHRGATHEALAQMNEALRLSADDPKLLLAVAEMQAALGQTEQALARVERSLDLDPHAAAGWALHGQMMQQAGLPRRALADYQKALGYEPQNRDVLLQIAEIYRQLNDPQQAMVNLHAYLDLYADGEEPQQALYLLGQSYAAMARYDDAAETLRLALRRGPPTGDILYQLADVEMRAGRPAAAQAIAQEMLALEPQGTRGRELYSRAALALQPAQPTLLR